MEPLKERMLPIFTWWRGSEAFAIRMVIKFGVSIYTVYTLFVTWEQINSVQLSLSTTAPTSYCVPFFDQVGALVNNDTTLTRAAYDYVAGVAVVRICTNLTKQKVQFALNGFSTEYDPMTLLGCDLRIQAIQTKVSTTCVTNSAITKNCSSIVNLSPFPDGYNWAFEPTLVAPNCSIAFTEMSPALEVCRGSYVGSYKKEEKLAAYVTWGTILIPIAVTVFQLIAYVLYLITNSDSYLAYVAEGLIAPVVYGIDIIVRKRPVWPDLDRSMQPFGVLLLVLQALAEGLICPIVATLGCNLDRYPKQIALLILKSFLVVYILANYGLMAYFGRLLHLIPDATVSNFEGETATAPLATATQLEVVEQDAMEKA